ncbi:MAG: competence/damage-inducible protein A [Clostridia bacterium]|nr:competence/damage-inducible protein A [Clostridia bacterium]
MISEIICVGTELLTGDTVNTNASYIAKRLMGLSSGCLWQSVVGDNPSRLSESILTALKRSELIVLTGGLGPTEDDLTKETAAELLVLPLYEDAKSLNDISSYFASKGREMPNMNKKQALIPKGAVILENEIGTAPGILLDFELLKSQGKFYSQYKAKYLILLPGPPREMKMMWESAAEPYLKAKITDLALVSHYMTVFGIGESAAAERLGDIVSGANPTVSPYAKNGSVTFRITANGKSEKDAEAKCLPVIEKMKELLGDSVVGTDVGSMAEVAVSELKGAGKTVALAESCTGGLIAKKLTDVSGASEVFKMGAVTYSNEIKSLLLSVGEDTLCKFGAVSEQTALEMCKGAAELSGDDFGVSVTGIAGPLGGSEEKPVGTVWIGIYSKKTGKHSAKRYLFGHGRVNERDYIRELTAETALWELIKTVREEN